MAALFKPTTVLLPQDVDWFRWAVIAADQHSASLHYWQQVEDIVGQSPSTLRMMVPEVFLPLEDSAQARARIARVHEAMRAYAEEVLVPRANTVVYVERASAQASRRRSMVLALDLEQYSYEAGADTQVRASEATVVERIPVREQVRAGATLELPHAQVLFDDPDGDVFGLLPPEVVKDLEQLYDTDLMLDGGHVRGWRIDASSDLWQALNAALERVLTDPDRGFGAIVGDGNHSLTTAKMHWEQLKSEGASEDHPARYALVEVLNVHEEGLVLEPIHRLLQGVDTQVLLDAFEVWNAAHPQDPRAQVAVVSAQNGTRQIEVAQPGPLLIEAVQQILDTLLAEQGLPAAALEYVHGSDATRALVAQTDSVGLLLPTLSRSALFDYVSENGTMPRKSFSLGEAEEKRYYLECRRIVS
ncbi:DUF1015 family protein [Gleimia hominis]|uniref:DUF1015 family protein n=1 Tax=Gleimia hominis TaxID=595468 RepID=A0ABU3IC59_9ACTO|nr:DUF1015 family protein [Gleimia hominis]MDT3767966.1 DUF1015 family protein [Gleimia hominis]